MKSIFPDAAGYLVTEYNTSPCRINRRHQTERAIHRKSLYRLAWFKLDYFCIHNGVSPDKYGLVYGTRGQKRNTSYYAIPGRSEQRSIIPRVYSHYQKPFISLRWVVSDTRPEACSRFWYRIFHRKNVVQSKYLFRFRFW